MRTGRTWPRSDFAQQLRAGAPLIGTFVFSPDAAHSEIVGASGYDFTIVDMEHAGLGEMEVLGHIRAADAAGISTLVRLGTQDPQVLARMLDLGAAGVVIPHAGVDIQATAALCRTARYAPRGTRPSCRGVRAASYGGVSFDGYVRHANDVCLTVGLIEDASSAERIDEVLRECEFDMIMPGPNDLASSLGLHGQLDHPDVSAVINKVVEAVHRSGTTHLAMYVNNAEEVPRWHAKGISIFVSSIDYRLLQASYASIAREIARLIEVPGTVDGD